MPPSRAELAAKHARVRELAAAGQSTAAIARELGMDRRDVRKVRAAAGIPALPGGGPQPLTVEEKWRQRTRPIGSGHLEWAGETATGSGTPVMRHSGHTYTAARIAYRIQHGTEPAGRVGPGCGMPHCVAPAHQDDTARQQRDRAALRIVMGSAERPATCRHGHDQSMHGALLPDGRAYCTRCTADRKTS
jgi:hypothetical protein